MARVFAFSAFLFLIALLPAQEAVVEISPGGEAEPVRPFPLALLLEAAALPAPELWQPHWPPEFPPDAFRPLGDNWTSISINGYGEHALLLKREGNRMVEFPWFVNGVFTRVSVRYASREDGEPLVNGIDMGGTGLEVLEYVNLEPSVLRARQGGRYSFVYLDRNAGGIHETWYDEEGVFLEYYDYRLLPGSCPGYLPGGQSGRIRMYSGVKSGEELIRDFDSRYLVTALSGGAGDFSLYYYRDFFPRYLKRQSGAEVLHYSYQWDEKKSLTRLSGEVEHEESGGRNYFCDARYEYTFDERGNWIERREIRMRPHEGLLIPSTGAAITRVVEYAESP